jgi:hypothetical protein
MLPYWAIFLLPETSLKLQIMKPKGHLASPELSLGYTSGWYSISLSVKPKFKK